MRSLEQINKIKQQFSNPYSVDHFVSPDDITALVDIYNSGEKTYKNTGPVTLDLQQCVQSDAVQRLLAGIQTEIGPFEVTAGLFFKTSYPHIIHNDDTFELPNNVYKAITIPLCAEGFNGVHPKLCFFDQHYFHGPAKFFNGSDNVPTYYNAQIYDYCEVDGTVYEPIQDPDKLFTHLNPKWLQGLSVNSVLDWVPGQAIIFDSVQLHCASDFRQLGIKSKLGLSIFTKKI